ncbi:LOW QUALITY PROTEIN: uncharacterized protein FYW35_000835 [Pterocles gutturalis]
MVSREPPAGAARGEGSQEKAVTVRSVLLNRDSPDVESRLRRRRSRTQQVRFKDPVEGGAGPAAAPGPPPRASPPPGDAPAPAALCASRRSWPPAPGSLTLTLPRKACMSTAIQTSPSLQKPCPAQPHSRSACDVAGDAALPAAAVGSARSPGWAVPPAASPAVSPRAPSSVPTRDRTTALAHHAAACRVPPPPPRDPCAPSPGTVGCPAARCSPLVQSCTPAPCPQPPACPQLRGNPQGGRGPPTPASVPCGQPRPPNQPQGLSRSDSERTLPRGCLPPPPRHHPTVPTTDPPATPSQLRAAPRLTSTSSAARPGGALLRPASPTPPAPRCATAATERTPAVPGGPDPHGTCSRLHTAEPGPSAPQGPGVGTLLDGWAPEPPQHRQPCLAPVQPEALSHIQDLLQLVVVAQAPAGPTTGDGDDTRTSQGEGPQGPGRGDLRSQLQSLEGVLETSQQTIRMLLDVIQDLEKKEAQRDGRHSYRTGQDITNCGRDCACIIYSVEHDWQQEGRFQRVLSHMQGGAAPSSPAAAGTLLSPRDPPPVPKLPVKLDVKKSRRKCFWFL